MHYEKHAAVPACIQKSGPALRGSGKLSSDRYGMMSRLLRTREFGAGLWIKIQIGRSGTVEVNRADFGLL